jgi:hypothetical protein
MNKRDPWFIAERAEHLAVMVLTRAAGAVVAHAPFDAGIDLLVSTNATSSSGVFGVEVKGAMDHRRFLKRDNTVRKNLYRRLVSLAKDAPFPVGVLVMGMADDTCLFGWVLEPQIPDRGPPRLRINESVYLVDASSEHMSGVFRLVDAWFERLLQMRGGVGCTSRTNRRA